MSASFTQIRQRVIFGRGDFAGVFAQLGFDVVQAELLVDFLFGFPGDELPALQRGQRVFV